MHENWSKSGILDTLKGLASQRTLQDLTVRARGFDADWCITQTESEQDTLAIGGVYCTARDANPLQKPEPRLVRATLIRPIEDFAPTRKNEAG